MVACCLLIRGKKLQKEVTGDDVGIDNCGAQISLQRLADEESLGATAIRHSWRRSWTSAVVESNSSSCFGKQISGIGCQTKEASIQYVQ